MKRFKSAGGQIEFDLDDAWIAEAEGNGMLYYDPRPDSGALRLSVMTLKVPFGSEPKDRLTPFAQKQGVEIERLPNGFWMISWDREGVEDGVPIRTRIWQLSGSRWRTMLAPIFSYTVDVAVAEEPIHKTDLAMVEAAIRGLKARF